MKKKEISVAFYVETDAARKDKEGGDLGAVLLWWDSGDFRWGLLSMLESLMAVIYCAHLDEPKKKSKMDFDAVNLNEIPNIISTNGPYILSLITITHNDVHYEDLDADNEVLGVDHTVDHDELNLSTMLGPSSSTQEPMAPEFIDISWVNEAVASQWVQQQSSGAKSVDLVVGAQYANKDDLISAIKMFHLNAHAEYKVTHSNSTRLILKCARFLPITALVQLMFYRVNSYFAVRREQGEAPLHSNALLTTTIEDKLTGLRVKANGHELTSRSDLAWGPLSINTVVVDDWPRNRLSLLRASGNSPGERGNENFKKFVSRKTPLSLICLCQRIRILRSLTTPSSNEHPSLSFIENPGLLPNPISTSTGIVDLGHLCIGWYSRSGSRVWSPDVIRPFFFSGHGGTIAKPSTVFSLQQTFLLLTY
ncbi:hypothetical protein MRB53_001854 [Persea americana]|uniref:Uncharacterized protein n=1 Tax=Persea americana TaxID=3435 RepID=A0ACC2MTT2_PERAE|nr:hypothetical protein MRB53_001854 [Persea americana]